MTTRSDPLEVPSLEGPDRLNYIQGTLLDSDDFTAEQRYHRGRLARGLEYLFGPGTIAGLDIEWRQDDREIAVTPGLALDPLGRLIEVPKRQCIRIPEWFRSQRPEDLRDGWINEFSQAVLIADIFIRFRVVEQGKTPRFADGPFDATDAVAPARLRDDFELGLVVREEAGARRQGLPGPPPAPVIPVPDADAILLGIPAGDLTQIHDRILALWRDEVGDWASGRPPRLSEHLAPRLQLIDGDQTQIGRDTSSLMLARLALPVNEPGADGVPTFIDTKPLFDSTSPIVQYRTGKFIRRFVYAFGHLTQPVGDGP